MTQPILVTGATGTLGRAVVRRLAAAGHEVRSLSRRPGEDRVTGDLVSGEGVQAAVEGVASIIHCASDSWHPRNDIVAAQRLIEAARRAGGPHLVYISIVGIDRMTYGYYRAKLAVEQLVADSGLPWTTLRATQFFDLVLFAVRKVAKLPVIPVPARTAVQPVDAGEVAARLIELTLGEPAGRVPDMGGPQVWSAADLIRAYLTAAGRRRAILPVWVPGKLARAMRAGGLTTPERAVGRRTWEEFLAERLGQSRPGPAA